MEKRNVPKLRFKGFEDEWKEYKLGDLGKSLIGLTYSPDDITDDKQGSLVLRSSNIKNGKLVFEDNVFVSTLIKNDIIVKNGDVLICSRNGSRALIGKSALIKNLKSTVTFGAFMTIFRSENGVFIYQLLNTREFFRQINMNLGATINQITSNNLNNFKFKIPEIEEQVKIANFLSNVDNIIEEQEGKVKDLEQYKKGMMQKIFKQEVRFRDDNGREYPEWEERLIEEVCDIRTGKKDTKDKIENGRYPFFVRSQKVERIDTYSYEGEAILTAGDGVGVGKVFHYVNCKFDYHQRVYKLSDFKGINGKFLYEYFSKNFIREVFKYNAKTSVDSVRLEMINKMKLPCPCIEEQTKIANFLSNIDNIIEEENKKLEDLKLCKKGLLQQMFV